MPEPKPEPGIEKVTDDKEPKLLGKTVKSLNLLYLCSLGRLMAMLSDRNQSTGILGNACRIYIDATFMGVIYRFVNAILF